MRLLTFLFFFHFYTVIQFTPVIVGSVPSVSESSSQSFGLRITNDVTLSRQVVIEIESQESSGDI